jgi:3-hydroxyacyl-CoA dehydrogenase
MGSRIAAHFANAGYPALLLDMETRLAQAGTETALKQRPGAFFTPSRTALITPGNFDQHLGRIAECEWVIEAVVENLAAKRALLKRVSSARQPGTILSTNTSGIPLARISEGFSDDLHQHFLGTHFFNPPRHLHLAEVIPGPHTDPAVLRYVSEFCDVRLGKGIAVCKDTPNFIGNRIGSFFGATVHKLTVEYGFGVEEVDALTGPLIGLPRSASYRLMDIVGLDVWAHVTRNLQAMVPHDPWRDRFVLPPFAERMIERGWLGEKTGQGFYKRVGKEKEIHAVDFATLDYRPARKVTFPSVEAARNVPDLDARLRMLVKAPDRAGEFLWKLFSDHIVYAASMVPEISDRIVEIDRAMRWGYANQFGPFELWDALGVTETAKRIESEGRAIPENVQRMLSSGATSFYRAADRDSQPHTEYFDLPGARYATLEERPGIIVLSEMKRARGLVKSNAGASLIDLGDGVLCLEFHSKMNTLGEDAVSMIHAGLEEAARAWQALLIANQGEHFSAGANLMLILLAVQEGEWDELEAAAQRFQQANMALKYAAKPVVAAPFGMTLGGGCEVAMHASRVQASAETYMGLVEVGVGLIPGAGGCKEMLLRTRDLQRAFETIGLAKVSTSAEDARDLRLLRREDGITMNPERLIGDAKAAALALAPSYAPGAPRQDIPVAGESGFAVLKTGIYLAREAGQISEHDALIGEKLAYVLSGGRLTGEQTVSEQYLLDLEREAFLSLCGLPKTQERMQHMLKTGKPLRN